MLKKVFLFVFLAFLVSCGSTNSKSSLTKKKKKRTELINKASYRAQLNKKPIKSRENGTMETLEATSRLSVTNDMIREYIMRYKDIAKNNMADHGVPASITLAQGVLESGSGQGTLSQNANNHFGIKCHQGWEGESVRHTDDAPDECFRKYETAEESYRDHSMFLTKRGRYSKLFELDKGDYIGWARGLRAAGYATDPKYPEKLISLIERYQLFNFDAEVLGNKYVAVVKSVPVTTSASALTTNYNSYKVSGGDTLFSISKRYNLTVAELQKLNNLPDNTISVGQILKIK
ncbi:glucosaminidase domain-containing protein [Flavobacterium sp. NKUCC04_CG]|uniref:glucosaminidase domain-containing protein n=1 Tax=Flavobacterium sp. NKUCC04_CG TaxID=2842121 RepID=UPI001C5AB3F0|nr:glucosaminidase domain-containing protein [Flavobacterium sp. NKUCC04_CG]MBW3517739.1 glucosaminidase domain-containing protein [Flavobacterium sp. NKUCC04_CG]